MGVVNALFLMTSLGAAILCGMGIGRTAERAVLDAPVVLGSGERRRNDYEDELRKRLGAGRRHPDPENASIIRRLRVHR